VREPPGAERSKRKVLNAKSIVKLPLWASLLIALAAGGAIAWLLFAPGDTVSNPTRPETDTARLSQAARSNYRVLTLAESERFLDYADALRACLVDQGIALGEPTVTRERVSMALEANEDWRAAARTALRCNDSIGEPTPKASQVLRPRTLEIYVPKRCLLDPHVSKKRL
jgi:hypothetical protein